MSQRIQPPAVTAESVMIGLRRAGVTEMLLREGRCRPAEYRTAWPEFCPEWSDWPPEDAEPSRPIPTAADITHHDLVRQQISAGVQDRDQRRVMGWRMLTWWPDHSLDGYPVHDWDEIGRRVRTDARTAEARWDTGVHRLAVYLDQLARVAATKARLQVAWALREPGEGLCHVVRRARLAPRFAPAVDGIRAVAFG